MIINSIKKLWTLPKQTIKPYVSIWDKILFLGLIILAIIEISLRADSLLQPYESILVFIYLPALLFRKRFPFWAFFIPIQISLIIELITLSLGINYEGLYTEAFMLILFYSLFRYGSGKSIFIGMLLLEVMIGINMYLDDVTTEELIAGTIIVWFPPLIAISMRIHAASQERQIEQVKTQEREMLARELHDTVAHHMSAVAVQAQAGLVVAKQNPAASVEALENIQEAATKSLLELRTMVKTLRQYADQAELCPQSTLNNIDDLKAIMPSDTKFALSVDPKLMSLPSSLQSAIYRISQESITNAVRHAQQLSSVSVEILQQQKQVRLMILDDGKTKTESSRNQVGFGLIGMSERASLLGGSFRAGPTAPNGWLVEATFPIKEI